MITEERIRELIKDNKTIYFASSDNGINVPRIDDYDALDLATLILSSYSKQLYETKADWEFDSKFRNITSTKTLDLPTWEEFEKMKEFLFDDMYGSSCIIHGRENKDNIYLESVRYIYKFDYSYNGYLEACLIAKKLFLGEVEYEKI